MTTVTYGLPATNREIGMRDPSQALVAVSKAAPRAGALGPDRAAADLLVADEKSVEGDELSRSYIPLTLARSKMAALSQELGAMKAKHMQLLDSVAARYEAMTADTRKHFEGIVDEVKARASLRLKENKASMEELREEIVLIQEAQAAKNAQYRAEIKAGAKEQGRLQQLLIDAESEVEALRVQHDAESAKFEARKGEIDTLMATRVPREELEALQAQKDELEQRAAAETRDFEEKHGVATSEAEQLRADLADLTAKHEALQSESEAAAASLAEKEEELQRARTEAEETKTALTAAEESVAALTTQLSDANTGSEAALEEARAETRTLQDRLTEQEERVASLETQLSDAQASMASVVASGGGGEGGSGSGTARVVLMPDPELQSRVRALEGEMNRLLRENADLTKVVLEREEAVSASNDALARAKAQAKDSSITAMGVGGGSGAEEEEEQYVTEVDEDAPSEYEDQEVQEEVTEEVAVGGDEPGSEPAATEAAADDPRRTELGAKLASAESSLADRASSIGALERELKPKVVDYKARLQEFKSDTERKQLESSLGFDKLVDEEGGEAHELRPADLKQLEDMLQWNESQAALKPQLGARVATLKEAKKTLESNKTVLADLKNAIGELKAGGADPDAVKTKEQEFLALRTRMQADATELKSSYAEYESNLKEFKAREAELQGLFVKFHVDPDHGEDKPRKLDPEMQGQIERLIALVANKSKERDLLKALAEEVNQKNSQLKALKVERDALAAESKDLQQQIESLPPPPSATPVRDPASTPRTVTKTFMRTVTKRVKKPKPMRRRLVAGGSKTRSNGAAAPAAGGSESHVPAALLNNLKPIDLRGKGKYAPREYTPVTPTVFKAATTVEDTSAAAGAAPAPATADAPAPSSSSPSGASDPALQAKYDTLFAKSQRLQKELDEARMSSSSSAESLAARETELAQLREQIRILTEENPDERVGALSVQLAAQRAEVDAVQVRHQERLAEVTQRVSAARAETDAKSDEIAQLKAEVKTMQDKVKQANAKASAAARSSGGAAMAAAVAAAAAASADGTAGGGVVGGVDPAVVAQYEAQVGTLEERVTELEGQVESTTGERDAHARSIAELQARIAELEAEAQAHAGSLADQLARKEADLSAAHQTRVSELEAQINENVEKLRITKKKAKELHEALTIETARREGLEADVTGLKTTIADMEESTAAAKASVDGLKSEIAARDSTIAAKSSEIVSLQDVKSKLETEVSFLEVRNVEEIRRRKEFQFKYEDAKGKVRVYARVRPFSKAEVAAEEKTLLRPGTNEWTLCINETQKNYQGVVTDNWRPIEFDHVFQFGLENTKGNASQLEVFEETKIFAELSVQGINCCVFAYGQSGTGKCWAPGTLLMMYDGTPRPVELVRAGDVLMGDDSTPRTVQAGSVIRDEGDMYRIEHPGDERDAWEVNGDHILVLRLDRPPRIDHDARGGMSIVGHVLGAQGLPVEVRSAVFYCEQRARAALAQMLATWQPLEFECTVLQYLQMDAALRASLVMFQPELITFPPPARSLQQRLEGVLKRDVCERELLEAAWAVGVWIAGDSNAAAAAAAAASGPNSAPRAAMSAPAPVVERMQRWQASVVSMEKAEEEKKQCDEKVQFQPLCLERADAFFRQLMPEIDLLAHKYFPAPLLQESVSVRRSLLAGVLDGSGSAATAKGAAVAVPVPLGHEETARGLKHLVRSLGFGVAKNDADAIASNAAPLHFVRIDTSGNDLAVLHPLLTLPLKLSPSPSSSSSPSFSPHNVPFIVTPLPLGRFHGFTLDGNGRLLLSNALVTHNTFTMAGIKPNESNGFTAELLGLKPRMIQRVYEMKQELRKTHDIDISCYMLEIYLNKLEDVFWKLQTQQKYAGKEKAKWPEPPELKVRVDAKRKVTIDNSIILKFDTANEMQEFCDLAEATRRVRKTGLNEESSRSHLIFALICTATDKKTGKKTTGKLSLVDLAGSERSDKTNVEGLSKAARASMLEEGIAINESLRMLKSVFRILGEANKPLAKGQKAEIVQYRGNMLTELMQDSLGGNAKTLMFVNVGPAASNISESVDSLAYGDLVKNITNEKVSADADLEEQLRFLQVQLRAYEAKFGALDA